MCVTAAMGIVGIIIGQIYKKDIYNMFNKGIKALFIIFLMKR